MLVRPATAVDLDGLVASTAALFAEDGAARDALRNADWPATHGLEWCTDLLGDPQALVLVAVSPVPPAEAAATAATSASAAATTTGPADEVVGHLVGTFTEPSDMWTASRAELVSMYVRGDLRGQGVGGQLVDVFVEWAKNRGAAQMHVTAYATNEGALRLYASRGFAAKSITLAAEL